MAAPVPASPAGGGVASPCISVCRMLQPSGWCEGCLRTIDEIAAWGAMDDADRRAVLLRLGPRRLARRAQRAADRGEAAAPGAGESP